MSNCKQNIRCESTSNETCFSGFKVIVNNDTRRENELLALHTVEIQYNKNQLLLKQPTIGTTTETGSLSIAQTDGLQTALTDLSNSIPEDLSGEIVILQNQITDLSANKQDLLTAGTGIDITNNVISSTGGSSPTVTIDGLGGIQIMTKTRTFYTKSTSVFLDAGVYIYILDIKLGLGGGGSWNTNTAINSNITFIRFNLSGVSPLTQSNAKLIHLPYTVFDTIQEVYANICGTFTLTANTNIKPSYYLENTSNQTVTVNLNANVMNSQIIKLS